MINLEVAYPSQAEWWNLTRKQWQPGKAEEGCLPDTHELSSPEGSTQVPHFWTGSRSQIHSHPRAVTGWRRDISRFTRRTGSTQSMWTSEQWLSWDIRQLRARQAARPGSRMTDRRFKTGHHQSPETRQGFIRKGICASGVRVVQLSLAEDRSLWQ